ncbi:hypothetical protein NQ318_014953 [Aromia moschata]|uniref:Terminase small subunit n=1 Tax=Aromia moschata TaxID=1265417 RepID=A0AAV8X699_9CUCU|nr:hypothetical protein NQ318_014953 [Aromia moschata]
MSQLNKKNQQKLQVIEYFENGMKNKDLSEKYKLHYSAISKNHSHQRQNTTTQGNYEKIRRVMAGLLDLEKNFQQMKTTPVRFERVKALQKFVYIRHQPVMKEEDDI